MREKNTWLRDYGPLLLTGVVVGVAALVLTALGNPGNMGFASPASSGTSPEPSLHNAAKVQYLRLRS